VRRDVVADPEAVSKGDLIMCGGVYAPVIAITRYKPGGRRRPAVCPIRADYVAFAFRTARGTRWVGKREN
jgi:hypothetical protein